MAKRGATKELNHDNWNDEEEPEEAGTMARASKNELEKRVIIKAKRRNATETDGKKSAFAGFAGFGAVAAKPPASTFSFLTKSPAATTTTPSTDDKKKENGNGVDTYSADIKKLNSDFAKWIQKCVDNNPLCNLTPIFEDYKKYLKEIESEKDKKQQNSTTSAPISFGAVKDDKKPETSLPAAASTFKFGDASTTTKPATSTFSFGNALSSSSSAPKTDTAPKFSFGSSASATTATPAATTTSPLASEPAKAPVFSGFGTLGGSKPFSFGTSSTPFSFGGVTQAAADKKDDVKEEEGDDEDQPPKVEFTPVVEEDSIYSKRCKVFVKVDKEFKDRGVGTLYIKSVEDGAKTQVIVRADTSLGNLLLNMLLTKETPTSRTGKNNVMVGTVVDGKPTSVLLRVKTGEDADELLATLEKNKK
ncbi:nuclear pore complex protein Nup50 [Culicoides brevitarsis]|uniref:nuclear pore complex protein Nup50 n=1 Tax=Culicoides brevitarsis TaxID=469753 RepID=UPI00307B77E2